jgi:micrococcal nuclease
MLSRPAIFFLLILSCVTARAADFTGRVVAVADGDSIEVARERRTVRIRIFGIDCPEGGQPYGKQAKQFTSSLAFGKTVTIIPKATDDYGRIIAEVILPDGRNVGKELVRRGLAWWYRQYDPGDREMEKLERAARLARRGLWRDRNPVPPWEWRHRRPVARTDPGGGDTAATASLIARKSCCGYPYRT